MWDLRNSYLVSNNSRAWQGFGGRRGRGEDTPTLGPAAYHLWPEAAGAAHVLRTPAPQQGHLPPALGPRQHDLPGQQPCPVTHTHCPPGSALVPPAAAETRGGGTLGRPRCTRDALPATSWEAQVQWTHTPGLQARRRPGWLCRDRTHGVRGRGEDLPAQPWRRRSSGSRRTSRQAGVRSPAAAWEASR